MNHIGFSICNTIHDVQHFNHKAILSLHCSSDQDNMQFISLPEFELRLTDGIMIENRGLEHNLYEQTFNYNWYYLPLQYSKEKQHEMLFRKEYETQN